MSPPTTHGSGRLILCCSLTMSAFTIIVDDSYSGIYVVNISSIMLQQSYTMSTLLVMDGYS